MLFYPYPHLISFSATSQTASKRIAFVSDDEIWPDFEQLTAFPNLRILDIASYFDDDIPDLADLKCLLQLEHLHISFFVTVSFPMIEELAVLPSLKILEISTRAENLPNPLIGFDELGHLEKIIFNLDHVTRNLKNTLEDMKLVIPNCEIIVHKWKNSPWSD